METIDDFLVAFRQDSELNNIVLMSEILRQDPGPRNRRRRGFTSKGVKIGASIVHFWASIEGSKLQLLFETKYGVNIGSTKLGKSMQTALTIYISEVIGK